MKSFINKKGSSPDVMPPQKQNKNKKQKNGAASYTNKGKATTLDQFFSSQSIIEDNNDIPDVLEFVTV